MNGNALAHFRLRQSSWYMAAVNLGIGVAMVLNPGMLTENPGANIYFAHLSQWVSPEAWRNLFIFIGASRLAALYVNGTFPSIWWTHLVRLAMSIISFLIWVEFASALIMSGVISIGTVLYSMTALIELSNIAVAATETRGHERDELG